MSRAGTALRAFGTTALIFLPLDAAWLSLAGPALYRPALGQLLAERPDFGAAALFYGLYIAGLVALVLRPFEAPRRVGAVARDAAIYGLVTYATYDLTNQATLAGWPWHLTALDLVWGTTVTTVAATLSRLLRRQGRPIETRPAA